MCKTWTAIFVIGFSLMWSAIAYGQDVPKYELFGGYTYVRSNFNTNANGVSISLTRNVSKYFGWTAEFSEFYSSHSDTFISSFGDGTLTISDSSKIFTIMTGPKFALRNHTRFTPFGQALIGVYRFKDDSNFSSSFFTDNTENRLSSLAATVGGGLDIKLTNHLAVRAAQVDYLYLRQLNLNPSLRISTGLVLRLGK